MSKHYDRVNKIENDAKNFVVRLFTEAKKYGWTSRQITQEVNNYRNRKEVHHFPRYVSSYLSGMVDVMTTLAYANDLEFCYMIGTKKYSIRRESDMYYEKHGITPKDLYDKSNYSGYYWIDTGHVYFGSEKK